MQQSHLPRPSAGLGLSQSQHKPFLGLAWWVSRGAARFGICRDWVGGPRERACAGRTPGAEVRLCSRGSLRVPTRVPCAGSGARACQALGLQASLGLLFSSPSVIDRGLSERRLPARSEELSGFNFWCRIL